MPTKRAPAPPVTVEAFLATLDHPLKAEILALRRLVLDADGRIGEEIKWNAPSFHTSEHFATFHLRAPDNVQVILHFGAKKRDRAGARAAIADPSGLLQWLAEDRATLKFQDMAGIEARGAAFTAILRQWIELL